MGLLPLDKPGKTCVNNARVFHAHAAPVSDWQFSPFDDNLLATGGEEGAVKDINPHSDQYGEYLINK